MTNQQKAKEFLEYIANNLPRLRKALKKNITYDEDIFEDVIQESILKIYNTIIKNNTCISNYEQYFFIVSKFTYIYYDNRKKKNETIEIRDLFTNGEFDIMDDAEDKEERYESTLKALNDIREYLIETFDESKTDIYLSYMMAKSNGRTSYNEIAREYSITSKEVSTIINEIKSHLLDNRKLREIKKKYTE